MTFLCTYSVHHLTEGNAFHDAYSAGTGFVATTVQVVWTGFTVSFVGSVVGFTVSSSGTTELSHGSGKVNTG